MNYTSYKNHNFYNLFLFCERFRFHFQTKFKLIELNSILAKHKKLKSKPIMTYY